MPLEHEAIATYTCDTCGMTKLGSVTRNAYTLYGPYFTPPKGWIEFHGMNGQYACSIDCGIEILKKGQASILERMKAWWRG